jgi:hypothetical protein
MILKTEIMSSQKKIEIFKYKGKFTEIEGNANNPDLIKLAKKDHRLQCVWVVAKIIIAAISVYLITKELGVLEMLKSMISRT